MTMNKISLLADVALVVGLHVCRRPLQAVQNDQDEKQRQYLKREGSRDQDRRSVDSRSQKKLSEPVAKKAVNVVAEEDAFKSRPRRPRSRRSACRLE